MYKSFDPTWRSLLIAIATIVVAWSLSSVGYYEIVDALHLSNGYNDAPTLMSVYYGVWLSLVIVVFLPAYAKWRRQEFPGENRLVLLALIVGFSFFALVVLPRLPAITIPEGHNIADIVSAEPSYFAPKTIEIMFQQILISALVLSLHAQGLFLRRITVIVAILFGGFHLTLALSGATGFYVARYTIAATLFGAAVPRLMLLTRNGFFYSLGLHWRFYAIDTTIGHFVFPPA